MERDAANAGESGEMLGTNAIGLEARAEEVEEEEEPRISMAQTVKSKRSNRQWRRHIVSTHFPPLAHGNIGTVRVNSVEQQ